MLDECLNNLHHFSSDHVFTPDNSVFYIEEKNKGGEGKAFFRHEGKCIVLKSGNSGPLIWSLKNKKIAEGAIITCDRDGFHLHLLEMKSRLTQGEWTKAILQFEGMFLTSIAAACILGIHEFKSVKCYIAYKENALSVNSSSDMIFLKTFVGLSNPFSRIREWDNEKVTLPFNNVGVLKKGARDANFDVDFGVI